MLFVRFLGTWRSLAERGNEAAADRLAYLRSNQSYTSSAISPYLRKIMTAHQHVHWPTPFWLVLTLVSGALFALGHHLFYASRARTAVSTVSFSIAGKDISDQQFNTAVGTAMAFLVKSCLTLAVSIAYIQAFWRFARTFKQGTPLSHLDTTFSILGNPTGFLKVTTWFKYPLLLALATVSWLVSLQRLTYLRL